VLKPAALSVNPSSAVVPTTGLAGVVNGASFIPGEDEVQFGTSAAQVTGGTTTTLNVIIPFFTGTFLTGSCGTGNTGTQQLPTSVPVTVTDFVTTCTSTLTGGFTYIPPGYPNNCVIPPPMPPKASFTFATSTANDVAAFTDTSTGNPTTWCWDFDVAAHPGTCDSSDPNPVHDYMHAGTFEVNLTVSNSAGSNTSPVQFVTVPKPM